METDPYTKFALSLFGGFVEKNSQYFPSLKDDLKRASMHLTVDEYVSSAMLTVLISPLLTAPLAFLLTIILGFPILTVFVGTFLVGFVTLILVASLLYFYPTIKADTMRKSIENNLPFAAIYLSTLAGTGMPTQAIFRILADFPEYGEISKQSAAMIADTEIFGMDIATALARAAKRTPSPELKELLWGMRSTITVGGDLKSFLIEKSKGYMDNYRRNIDMYVEELSLFTELYITAVIVGSIFFLVMSTIMNMVGGSGGGAFMIMIQNIVVYILLPLLSIGFMILVSMLSPT